VTVLLYIALTCFILYDYSVSEAEEGPNFPHSDLSVICTG